MRESDPGRLASTLDVDGRPAVETEIAHLTVGARTSGALPHRVASGEKREYGLGDRLSIVDGTDVAKLHLLGTGDRDRPLYRGGRVTETDAGMPGDQGGSTPTTTV